MECSLDWPPTLFGLVPSMFYSVDLIYMYFVVFVYIYVCEQIVIILIFSLSTDLYGTVFQISNIGYDTINNQPKYRT